jgi:hypothetical protein
MIEISEELLAHARSEAAVLGVNAALHEKDYILRFLLENPAFTNQDSALSYYFQDARKSAKQLSRLVSDELGLFGEHGFSMLEFASGYGCVTRHLPAVMSSWQIVSSDIHVEANAFNAENFGVEVLQSTTSPDDFPRHRKFRLVFALSFFSHMPPDTWPDDSELFGSVLMMRAFWLLQHMVLTAGITLITPLSLILVNKFTYIVAPAASNKRTIT